MPEDIPLPSVNQSSPQFSRLVVFFEKISNLSGVGIRDRRHELINGFISRWRQDVGNDIYPAFQLILPHLDSENTRRLYNIKEHKFGKLLVAAMNLNSTSADAKQLLEFRSTKGRSAGNFPELAYKIIDKRDTNLDYSKLTVNQVLEQLGGLSQAKFPEQVAILRAMISEMNAVEMKWIIRIILQSMHLHVSEHTFFHCWHPDSQALFNVTNDLKVVCHQLWDRNIRLEAKDQAIKPGSCFKPQRSKFRKNAMQQFKAVVEEMPDGFYIEEKMDGERMQVHWCDAGAATKFFSRKGKDYTSFYGQSSTDPNGSLSRELAKAINPKVKDCVLDGEVVAYDIKNEEICPLNKVKQAAQDSSQFKPLFMTFDIVHLNSKDLTSVALKERKRALEMVIKCPNQSIQSLPYMLASTEQQVKDEFEKAISQLSEGLIIKNPLSKYAVDGYNDAWIKIKPEFMSGYEAENFDLVIIGGYYGRGKRGSILASFLCAVQSENHEKFYTVCKVGNGICMAMYEKIKHLTEGRWVDFDRENIPQGVLLGSETPHQLIDPKVSLVFEVKATQIWPTDKFSSGYSLRFPRFVSLREDKSFKEALSLGQLLEVSEQQDPSVAVASKRTQKAEPRQLPKKARFQYETSGDDKNPQPLELQSVIFDGLLFFVAGDVRDPRYLQQPELEALLQSHGGKVTRDINQGGIIIADAKLPRVAHIIDNELGHVVHPRWVLDCIENERVLPCEPDHFYFADREDQVAALKRVDSAGISHTRRYRFEDIERVLNTVPPFPCGEDQLSIALERLMITSDDMMDTRGLMFHGLVVYFDPDLKEGLGKELKRYIQFGSGRVSLFDQSDLVTHVICDKKENRALYARHKGPFIVGSDWVLNSWSEETKLDELRAVNSEVIG